MTPETQIIGAVNGTGADLVPLPVPNVGSTSTLAAVPMLPMLPAVPSGASALPSPFPPQVREYIRASKAENTLRGYQSDWRDFCAWCDARNLGALPAAPETVAAY